MNPNKSPLILFMILLLAGAVIILNILGIKQEQQTLTIGLTSQQSDLLVKSPKIKLDGPYKVRFITYETEQELLQAIYAKKVSVYILDTYSYIVQYSKLPNSRAVFGIPSDYYLIAVTDQNFNRPRVGMLSTSISDHMLNGKVYSKHIYNDYKECLRDLNSGLIDQAVLQEKYVDLSKYKIISKLSSIGYKEDLLVITTSWLEKEDEEELSLLNSIAALFKDDIQKPNEAQLIEVMSELFTNESIPTRYYYKDLVYTNGL